MKLIMENWKKFVKEEHQKESAIDAFYRVCEHKQTARTTKKEQIVEQAVDIELDAPAGMGHVKIQPLGPWSAAVAISATAAYTAINIAALNAGAATGVAFFVTTSAIPLMIAGGFAWLFLKSKLEMPPWMRRVFDAFGKKQDPLETAQKNIRDTLKEIVKKTNLMREEAEIILTIVNEEVHKDAECQSLTEKLLKAIEDDEAAKVQFFTDKLDDAVTAVYERLMGQLKEMIVPEHVGVSAQSGGQTVYVKENKQ